MTPEVALALRFARAAIAHAAKPTLVVKRSFGVGGHETIAPRPLAAGA